MMKLNLIFSVILIAINAMGADYIIRQNTLKFGRPADAGDKVLQFDLGNGSNNPKLYSTENGANDLFLDSETFSTQVDSLYLGASTQVSSTAPSILLESSSMSLSMPVTGTGTITGQNSLSVTANQSITLDPVDSATIKTDSTKVGEPLSGQNKIVEFDINAGANNPKIQYDIATAKLQFAHDGVTYSDFGTGGGGGGGSSIAADPYTVLNQLGQEESSNASQFTPNMFIDPFRGDKGTKVNSEISNSSLTFSGSNLTASYQRDKETGVEKTASLGAAVGNLQYLAPSTDTITTITTERTVKFEGNVVSYFGVNKNVISAKRIILGEANSDSSDQYVFLFDSSNDLVKWTVSNSPAPVYDNITNRTTVVLSNADTGLDITQGIIAANNTSRLRFIPFDYKFKVNTDLASPTSGQYDEMDIVDAIATGQIAITGANNFANMSGATGSVVLSAAKCSPNGVYCVAMSLEQQSGNEFYRWNYSKDNGETWVSLGTKTAGAELSGLDASGSHHYVSPAHIGVSNNGHLFSVFSRNSPLEVAGVYSNLSDVTPTLNDSPATHEFAAGKIIGSAANTHAQVAIDEIDGDYITVLGKQDNSTSRFRWFTWTGGTPVYQNLGDVSNGSTHQASSFPFFPMSIAGANGAERTFWAHQNTSGNNLELRYFPYLSGTVQSIATLASGVSVRYHDGQVNGNSWYVLEGTSSVAGLRMVRVSDLSGSPTPGSLLSLESLDVDGFNGHSASDFYINLHKTAYHRLSNGSSETHMFAAVDLIHPDSVRRSHLFEIQDASSYQGVHQSETGAGTARNYRNAAGSTLLGQSFTANTNRHRTFTARVYQQGNILQDAYTLQAKIYATAAGIPTGAALYTSNNSYDPGRFTKSTSGQDITFNFDNVALSNGVVYAIVYESAFPISGTNFLTFLGTAAGSSIVGSRQLYDGSVWTAQAAGDDLYTKISGDYETVVGNAKHSTLSLGGDSEHNFETQIEAIGTSQIKYTTRLAKQFVSTATLYPSTGDIFQRTINISGVAGTQSTYDDLRGAAFGATSFDPNLVFNAAFGSDFAGRRNLDTAAFGAADTYIEDSSSWNTSGGSSNSPTGRVADASFQTGFGYELQGVTQFISISTSTKHYPRPPLGFAIEFEMKADTVATGGTASPLSTDANLRTIVSNFVDSGATRSGFFTGLAPNGGITLSTYTGASGVGTYTTCATIISVGVYYKIKILIDPVTSLGHVYYNGTECASYAVQNNHTTIGNPNVDLTIGQHDRGGGAGIDSVSSPGFDGRIGYVKIANGLNSVANGGFVSSGFVNQRAITTHQNLGRLMVGEMQNGQNRQTQDSSGNFDTLGFANADFATIATSPKTVFFLEKTLTTPGPYEHFLFEMGRASTTDTSRWDGMGVRFVK